GEKGKIKGGAWGWPGASQPTSDVSVRNQCHTHWRAADVNFKTGIPAVDLMREHCLRFRHRYGHPPHPGVVPCYASPVYWILAAIFTLLALTVPRLRPFAVVGCVVLALLFSWALVQRMRGDETGGTGLQRS